MSLKKARARSDGEFVVKCDLWKNGRAVFDLSYPDETFMMQGTQDVQGDFKNLQFSYYSRSSTGCWYKMTCQEVCIEMVRLRPTCNIHSNNKMISPRKLPSKYRGIWDPPDFAFETTRRIWKAFLRELLKFFMALSCGKIHMLCWRTCMSTSPILNGFCWRLLRTPRCRWKLWDV